MPQEIELKLSLCADAVPRLLALPRLKSVLSDQFNLSNTYFDTADEQLTRSGAALRIRRQGELSVQTLKTKGVNVGGLHQREEWEMPNPTGQLDLSLFPSSALPDGLTLAQLTPLFSTDFKRQRWLLQEGQSQIELVLDTGVVQAGEQSETLSELELELKSGTLGDLFALALEISEAVPVMPSDVSKAERGYRLLRGQAGVAVELPELVPQQSMESAFCALFGYEMERLQRHWDVFWASQTWAHLQAFLNTLGNIDAELDWFQGLMPTEEIRFVHDQICWIRQAVQPILAWWPACFELSQDAHSEPQDIAWSLQQSKAQKALKALHALQLNPELGHRILALTAWLHRRDWQKSMTETHQKVADMPVVDGIDYCFDKAWNDLHSECFAGSTSHALSQYPAVHRLLMLCQYFERMCRPSLGDVRHSLQALNDNLSKLSAMEVVTRLSDWLNELPVEQQASIHSWTRSQTVLLRDIKQLAQKLTHERLHQQGAPA